MSVWAVLLIAVGVSADAFAVALGKGLSLHPFRRRDAVAIGATFGLFQAGMPLIGYYLGRGFAPFIEAVDHWVAFVLLVSIGLNMLIKAIRGEDTDEEPEAERLSGRELLALGVATSIDALVIGVGLALLHVDVLVIVSTIGVVTFLLSFVGVHLGRRVGNRFGRPAAAIGGLILIGLGTSTLLEHLGVIG